MRKAVSGVCLCTCECVWDTHAEQGPVLLAWALPGVWLGANLAVLMGCKFLLQNYGMGLLAPLKKKEKEKKLGLLIYMVIR